MMCDVRSPPSIHGCVDMGDVKGDPLPGFYSMQTTITLDNSKWQSTLIEINGALIIDSTTSCQC